MKGMLLALVGGFKGELGIKGVDGEGGFICQCCGEGPRWSVHIYFSLFRRKLYSVHSKYTVFCLVLLETMLVIDASVGKVVVGSVGLGGRREGSLLQDTGSWL